MQSTLLLPVTYFMLTFTLPDTLNAIARSNQAFLYGLFFQTAAAALQKLTCDPKFVGGELGFFGVLQTWARDLAYHPHIHFIVAGGGLSQEGETWRPAHEKFLLPVPALSKIFRAKLRDALKKESPELFAHVPLETWKARWVVDIRPAGSGKTALKYLAPYIFRVAISNKRIVRFKEGLVTFRYQDHSGAWHCKTMTAEVFMACFLQHVLPKRFVKVRYYGLFHPRQRKRLQTIKERFGAAPTEEHRPSESSEGVEADQQPVLRCPKCGAPLLFVRELLPQQRERNFVDAGQPP